MVASRNILAYQCGMVPSSVIVEGQSADLQLQFSASQTRCTISLVGCIGTQVQAAVLRVHSIIGTSNKPFRATNLPKQANRQSSRWEPFEYSTALPTLRTFGRHFCSHERLTANRVCRLAAPNASLRHHQFFRRLRRLLWYASRPSRWALSARYRHTH